MSRLSKTLTFAEIGAHACESNCLFSAKTLKMKGVFFEASARHCEEGNRFMKMVGVDCKFARNFITPANVNAVLKKEGMTNLDIFSLDVDGHDYFILQALEFKPRIIIVEYNSAIDFNHGAATLPLHKEPAGDCHGASLASFQKLLSDYRLVYCEKTGVNAFFVREDLMHHFLDDQVFPHLVPNRGRDNFSPDIKHGEFEKV